MINPVKMYKMQQEAKKMQNSLREKKVVGESKDGRVQIKMNLAQEFEDISIDDTLLTPENMDKIKKGMEEAFKDYQKKMQKEAMKDFDIDQLKKMLG
jgi:DNA-binding protein YbaB